MTHTTSAVKPLTEAQQALIFEVMQEHETMMVEQVERAIEQCLEGVYRELDSHQLVDKLSQLPPHDYFAAVALQHLFYILSAGKREAASAIIKNLQDMARTNMG
ncbi:exonuclease V gamma subunit [Chitinivorax tropicus]|uniref:Exonuclease V gamma subunit n=1 Tax=Chitinivorax tropicus TaxID=714531 RepID=A0A840MQB8_9PROT|nr:hypothetical protein [Chitinivorax tropicus]MBB5019267.1 exonuclease V gamma subunit [Chitinivorax tropicus]